MYGCTETVIAALCLGSASGFITNLAPSKLVGPSRYLRMTNTETETTNYLLDGKTIGGPLTPISNSILVKVRDADKTSLSGIIIPDQAQERPTEGVVVAMGPGRKHEETGAPIPLPCSIGDKVLYGEFDGTAVNYMNTDYQFVRDNNILFVYSGEQMDLSTIKMIRDEILVKVDDVEAKTAGGVLLATPEDEDVRPKSSTGEVVAVGPGRTSSSGEVIPMCVGAGDFIQFRMFAGSEVKLQGVDYRVITMSEVLTKW